MTATLMSERLPQSVGTPRRGGQLLESLITMGLYNVAERTVEMVREKSWCFAEEHAADCTSRDAKRYLIGVTYDTTIQSRRPCCRSRMKLLVAAPSPGPASPIGLSIKIGSVRLLATRVHF